MSNLVSVVAGPKSLVEFSMSSRRDRDQAVAILPAPRMSSNEFVVWQEENRGCSQRSRPALSSIRHVPHIRLVRAVRIELFSRLARQDVKPVERDPEMPENIINPVLGTHQHRRNHGDAGQES